jgi:hypothetical protein
MQMDLAPLTFLQNVVVLWERDRKNFSIQKITYNFASESYRGLAVSVDNGRHLIYAETNAPGPVFTRDELLPVDFSGKDVREILQIALGDSLGAFCASVPPGNDTLMFQLQNSERGPFWHITGFGKDNQGALTQVRLDIDSIAGKVLSRSLSRTPAPRSAQVSF